MYSQGKLQISSSIRISRMNTFLFSMALFWYSMPMVDIVRKLTRSESITNVFRNSLYAVVFLLVLYDAIRSRRIKTILLPAVVFSFLLFISSMIYPQLQISTFSTDILLFFGRCLPGFYLATTVSDWSSVIKAIISWHWIGLVYAALSLISGPGVYSNYMSLSYGLLIPAVLTLLTGLKEKKIIWIISAIVMLCAIFACGARGPVICFLVAFFITLICINKRQINIGKLLLLMLLFSIIILFAVYYNEIVRFLYIKWPNSRTVRMIYNYEFFSDSGRKGIMGIVLSALKANPIFPRGIYADRILIAQKQNQAISSGIYPHNFFLEIWYQFGILGLAFSVYFLIAIAKQFIKCIREKEMDLTYVFACFVVAAWVKLMISGSYIADMQTWFCFGAMINLSQIKFQNYVAELSNEEN